MADTSKLNFAKKDAKELPKVISSSELVAKKSAKRKFGLTQPFWKTILDRITKVEIKPSLKGFDSLTSLDRTELRKIYEEERNAQGGQKFSVGYTSDLTAHYVRHRSTQYEQEETLLEKHLEAIQDNRINIQVSKCDFTRDTDLASHYFYGRKLEQAQRQWGSPNLV